MYFARKYSNVQLHAQFIGLTALSPATHRTSVDATFLLLGADQNTRTPQTICTDWYPTPAVFFYREQNTAAVHQVYISAVLPSGGTHRHISGIREYRNLLTVRVYRKWRSCLEILRKLFTETKFRKMEPNHKIGNQKIIGNGIYHFSGF